MIQPTQKEPQVAREFKILDKAQAQLSELLSKLEENLKPVLRIECERKEESKDEKNLCDLAATIRNKRKIVDTQIGVMESILRRLEI